MAQHATHWGEIAGDGQIYDGPCIVKFVAMDPDANQDYADIYDGRDVDSGVRFVRVQSSTRTTRTLPLGDGVKFGRGIYVDAKDSAVRTTVAFIPLE